MIAGSSLTIEIGSRILLRDASFTIGTGEKVGLVGRNGTGKSTLVSAVLGVPAPGVRVSGNARTRGTVGFLPQVPTPHGLGLDSTGFSHVLSARGLDVLDDGLTRARQEMEKDPTSDVIERKRWDDYMRAYEDMIRNTSTKRAPWHVIPADHKWFTRLAVAEAIIDAMEQLDLSFPKVDSERREDLKKARAALQHKS